jgi:hypothetical protein
MKAPLERDKRFLFAAWLAGVGGVTCVVTSVVFPLWSIAHGRAVEPTFVFFSLWGFIALAGAAANVYTYLSSGPPPRRPRGGGQPLATIHTLDARRASVATPEAERRAA